LVPLTVRIVSCCRLQACSQGRTFTPQRASDPLKFVLDIRWRLSCAQKQIRQLHAIEFQQVVVGRPNASVCRASSHVSSQRVTLTNSRASSSLARASASPVHAGYSLTPARQVWVAQLGAGPLFRRYSSRPCGHLRLRLRAPHELVESGAFQSAQRLAARSCSWRCASLLSQVRAGDLHRFLDTHYTTLKHMRLCLKLRLDDVTWSEAICRAQP